MTGLPTADYHRFAVERVAEGRRAIAEHVTSAYTGVCLRCGRTGPCDDLRAAFDLVARYGPAAVAPLPTPTGVALTAVLDSLDHLRAICATVTTAIDQAGSQLHGTDRAGERLTGFQRALTDAWQTLGEVYAGLHEARHLPDAPVGNVAALLAGLRAARENADRATELAAATRLRLIVAADRLTRTGSPAALVAARRFTTAITRLDLVTARLAVGSRAIDRYAAALGQVAGPARLALPAPPRPPAGPFTEISAGAHAAARLLTAARHRRHPTLWTRVRHQLRTEVRR